MLPNTAILTITALAALGAAPLSLSAHGALPERTSSPISLETSVLSRPAPAKNAATAARPLRLGENAPLKPPFCETFDNFRDGYEHDDFLRTFQIIDANDDGRNWGFYNYSEKTGFGRCAYLLFPMDVDRADDWLITRAVKLEKDKYYCVSLLSCLFREESPSEPQVFEVRMGRYNDAEGLSETVIPATEVFHEQMESHEGWFSPDRTANYYVGVHGISPTYKDYYNYLFVDNIAVDAPRLGTEPGYCSNLTLTNDPDGSTAIDIVFDAPALTIACNNLSAIDKLTVSRNGVTVKTFTTVTPGQHLTFRDDPGAEIRCDYTLTASNADGEGATTRVWRTAGIASPVPPQITSCRETDEGVVEIAWSVPATDVNGNAISPDKITYNIYRVDENAVEPLRSGLTATSAVFDLKTGPEQRLETLLVTATIVAKESDYAVSDQLAVGRPYTLPHENHFTDEDYYNYVISVETDDPSVVWRFLDDHSDPKSQDGDGGYVSMIGSAPGQRGEMLSGKIDFNGVEEPVIEFWTFIYEGDENIMRVRVHDVATGAVTEAGEVDMSLVNHTGWTRLTFPLDAVAGKIARIGIEGEIVSHGYIPVDNMSIRPKAATDLSIDAVLAPDHARQGEPFDVVVKVSNKGLGDVKGYTVSLAVDGLEGPATDCGPLKKGDVATITLRHTLSAANNPISMLTATVSPADGADGCPDDNSYGPVEIACITPVVPAVTDLEAVADDVTGKVTLTWSAPDVSAGMPSQLTEGFDTFEDFATELPGWTMHDVDGLPILGFQGLEMPVDATPQAFWVMPSETPYNFIQPYSGSKVLTQMTVGDKSDDWAVTPRLYGGPQMVSVKALSMTSLYGYESVEFLYSTGGTDPSDFTLLREVEAVPELWTTYFVYLPDGARHFAIRCTSDDCMMLMIDDVTFCPDNGSREPLTLTGYNVYRNGVRINAEPLTASTFETSRLLAHDDYFVTAVYDTHGESRASNRVGLGTALDPALADKTSQGEPQWYTLQGIRVSRPSVPGVYIVRRGATAVKTVIR